MNIQIGLVCVCLFACMHATQFVRVTNIETDNSVSSQMAMDHYSHLSKILKSAIKFYRVNSGKVYWMTGTLMIVASTDTRMPAANAASA